MISTLLKNKSKFKKQSINCNWKKIMTLHLPANIHKEGKLKNLIHEIDSDTSTSINFLKIIYCL
jgi:hypothetical protein